MKLKISNINNIFSNKEIDISEKRLAQFGLSYDEELESIRGIESDILDFLQDSFDLEFEDVWKIIPFIEL
mgnify:CR=1 FL=1